MKNVRFVPLLQAGERNFFTQFDATDYRSHTGLELITSNQLHEIGLKFVNLQKANERNIFTQFHATHNHCYTRLGFYISHQLHEKGQMGRNKS